MRIDEKPRYGELKRMIDAQKKREKWACAIAY